MAAYDFSGTRLFVRESLREGSIVILEAAQHNYIRNVMRLAEGSTIALFNGKDGEWLGNITEAGKRRTVITAQHFVRPQTPLPNLSYLFAPLKHARLDYMVQKAVEMGAGRLCPVITRRTQAARLNLERVEANVIEAAEQCGIIALPHVEEPQKLSIVLENWPQERTLIFCDEDAPLSDSIAQLNQCKGKPLAILIGPEGGFDPAEREQLLQMPNTIRLSLGSRILRADTAAVAALAVVQALCGDWQETH